MSNVPTRPLTIAHEKTETEIIRSAVQTARHAMRVLMGQASSQLTAGELRLGLAVALDEIEQANEARDKSRKLSVDFQMQVPDLSKEVCRGLLEIGFDTGSNALALCFDGGPAELRTLVNPFRRESTTVQEPPDIRQHKGPFGKGAPVTPEDEAFAKGCGGQPASGKCTCPVDPPGAARIAPDCPVHFQTSNA